MQLLVKTIAKRKLGNDFYFTGNFKAGSDIYGYKVGMDLRDITITKKEGEEWVSQSPNDVSQDIKKFVGRIIWAMDALQWQFKGGKLKMLDALLRMKSNDPDKLNNYICFMNGEFVIRQNSRIKKMPLDLSSDWKEVQPTPKELHTLDMITYDHRAKIHRWHTRQIKYGHQDINPYADYS